MFKNFLKAFKRIQGIDRRWLIIWVLIYFSFLFLDLALPHFFGATLVKYLGIFLCLVYAYQKFRFDTLLIIALLFTLLADTILIWTPYYVPGVYCFCFAQFFHIARFIKAQPKLLVIFFFGMFLIFAFGLVQGLPPIYSIAAIYAITLITNLVLSFIWVRREPRNLHARYASSGFLLFLACDTCVALQFLAVETVLPAYILPVVSFLVWFFYYPSQVLISNSSNLSPKKPLERTVPSNKS